MNEQLYLKDYIDRDALRHYQFEALRKTLERVYNNVPFYKQKFQELGVTPADFKQLSDLSKFPFTTKYDLRDHYPFGLFSSPISDVVRIHASSGTTGKPTVVGYTKNDLDIWSEVLVRSFQCAGLTHNDVVQNAYGYGLFTGGLGAHYGLERLGCTVVPMSGGNTEKQILAIRDFGVTALCGTPSYFMHIIEVAEKMGHPIKNSKLKTCIFGAEPWTNEMRRYVEEHAGVRAFDIYGLSEVIGPGVAMECEMHNRELHIFEDHFYPEIIDPDTGAVLPEGAEGELVFTMITKEALPLIRYRTRDITRLHYEKCGCGRTLVRMERVARRSDDMLIIRGVNLFPSQIEEVLLETEGTTPHYQIVVTREGALDLLEVRVELSAEYFSDEIKKLESLRRQIQERIKSLYGLSAKISLVEPETLGRSQGKAKRVLDLRNIESK